MRTVAAGVVLLLAAVSGCSAEDAAPAEVGPLASATEKPVESHDVSVAPSASGSTGPLPLSKPAADYPATVDGATAFAREYVRLIGQGFASASSEAVRKLSAPGCEGCEALMSAMDQAAADGLRQRGGEYNVSTVATPPINGGDVVLLLTYTRAASDILNEAGDVVDRAPAVPRTTVQMRLVHGPMGWLTQGYRVV